MNIIGHITLIALLSCITIAPYVALPMDRVIDAIICSLPSGSVLIMMIISLYFTIIENKGEI